MILIKLSLGFRVAFILLLVILLTWGTSGKSFTSAFSSPNVVANKHKPIAPLEDAPIQVYSSPTSVCIKHRLYPKLDAAEISVRNGSLEIAALPKSGASKLATATIQRYHAIFGFYKINDIQYIALVKSASLLPEYRPKDGLVFKVDQIELVALPNQPSAIPDNDLLVRKLTRKLNSYSFLYSVGDYDVLRTLNANECGVAYQHGGSVDRFYWNKNIIQTLARNADSSYLCTKFVNALVSSTAFKIGSESFSLLLIARRSRKQQGQRYIKRGIDRNGEVANYVEIEQIVIQNTNGCMTSFVQVRGSIPLYWSQPTPWKPKPDIVIDPDESSANMLPSQSSAMQKHIKHLASDYGLSCNSNHARLVMVNLVDKKGGQGALGKMWFDMLKVLHGTSLAEGSQHDLEDRSAITSQEFSIPLAAKLVEHVRCKYVWMDYHYQCQHEGAQEAIKKLKSHVQPLLESDDFLHSSKSKGTKGQQSLIRTNCVDCLDRTNVVQVSHYYMCLINFDLCSFFF